jgi:hypothetical protein
LPIACWLAVRALPTGGWVVFGGREIQNSNGKGQMENHLKFALCPLPFELLVRL